jgi:hypothetical protein
MFRDAELLSQALAVFFYLHRTGCVEAQVGELVGGESLRRPLRLISELDGTGSQIILQ